MSEQQAAPTTSYVPHYRALLDGLGLAGVDADAATSTVDTGFLAFLLAEFAGLLPLDPGFYGTAYRGAVPAGASVAELREHFIRIGYAAGLLPHPLPFDPAHYAAQNPDVVRAQAPIGPAGLVVHFVEQGRHEGRSAHSQTDRDAARWRRAVARTQTRLAHRTIDGGLVQAFLPPLLGPRLHGFRGGLVLSEDPADTLLRHRRGPLAVDSFPDSPEPVDALDGEFIYAGPYCGAFGHAMAETLHRVLPARALFDSRRLLFVGMGTDHAVRGWAALPATMQAALRFLDVASDEVTVLHDNRAVRRVHVVQQGAVLGGEPDAAYLRMLSEHTPVRLDALQRQDAPEQRGPRGARVYVSRSRIAHGGVLLGERYLEQRLEAEGWLILHPQDHPLAAQMQAYQHAEIVLFAEGSACHGVELFGAGGLAHCVLLPRRQTSRHVFDFVLRPRARRYDVLPEATLLGSVVADPRTGAALDTMGVSLPDLGALLGALRGLGLATLRAFDTRRYRRAARADLQAYIAYHRAHGTPMVEPDAVAAVMARCTGIIG